MRKVYLFGEICVERAESFIVRIHELFEESGDPIAIYINSSGGSVTDALGMYDVLRNAPCEIYTIALGKVHSAAMIVLLSAPKENRVSYANTEFMTHDISWKSDGSRAFLKNRVEQLERTGKQMLSIYTRDTNLTIDQARGLFFEDMGDHYLDAIEAMQIGFISNIIMNESARFRINGRSGLHVLEPIDSAAEDEFTPVN
jgi:ATP-dependent Clp protease, protease subunit